MCSACPEDRAVAGPPERVRATRASVMAGLVAAAFASLAGPVQARELRVCADPNNLPFSNERQEGFENRIASLLADQLHAELHYTWWAQRRGFIRNTLKAGLCDLVPGVSTGLDMLRTTRPYYRSTYVFATRAGAGAAVTSFDDPRLRQLRIGVQIIGDDGANTPPAHALTRRGIVANVRGYTVYGDYAEPDPAGAIMDALARGEIDIAIAWGPFAGYYATRHPGALELRPVSPAVDLPVMPMIFDIAMGVRYGDDDFRAEINDALKARRRDIDAILASYGVPRADQPEGTP